MRILKLGLLGAVALLLASCEGCTVFWAGRQIDRLAHQLVDDYCSLGEPERRLFRSRWNESSRHSVQIHCDGDLTP